MIAASRYVLYDQPCRKPGVPVRHAQADSAILLVEMVL